MARLVLLACAALSYACGGKMRDGAEAGADNATTGGSAGSSNAGIAAGTAGAPARLCDATLEGLDELNIGPRELDCKQGVHALGGGLYRLELTSAVGDNFVLTFPSVDSGFSASPACVTSSLALSNGFTYVADQMLSSDTVATLNLDRQGDVLSGSISGIFNGTIGTPSASYAFPIVHLRRAPLTRATLTCNCGEQRVYEDHCELPTCDLGQCNFISCPRTAAVCR